jgi:hypothetical protein
MQIEEERTFLAGHLFGARSPASVSEEELRRILSQAYGRELSLTYVRRLLDRHSVRDVLRVTNAKRNLGCPLAETNS